MREDKRAFMVKHFGEERVAALGTNWEEMEKELKAKGIAYKEAAETPAAETTEETPAAVETKEETPAAEVTETPITLDEETIKAMKTVAENIPAIIERLVKLEKSDDEKIADALTAAKEAGGHVATKADDNVVKEGDKDLGAEKKPDNTWFANMVAESPAGQEAGLKKADPPVETT